jgi:hypothetical protein
MAKVVAAAVANGSSALKSFQRRLAQRLVDGLKVGGIRAKVQSEPVPQTKLFRVNVIAPAFESLRPSERQDLVWRIVSQHFDSEDQLRISMILTLTPNELAGRWSD